MTEEKRTSLRVGSSGFISLNPLKTFFSSPSVSDVLMGKYPIAESVFVTADSVGVTASSVGLTASSIDGHDYTYDVNGKYDKMTRTKSSQASPIIFLTCLNSL